MPIETANYMDLSMISMEIETLGKSVTSSYDKDAMEAGKQFAKKINAHFIHPDEQSSLLNKVIDELYIVCHYTEILNKEKENFAQSVKHLAQKAKNLFLICCNGATVLNDGSQSIAQEVAQWTNKEVWAATDVVFVDSVIQGNPMTSGQWVLCKPDQNRMDLE